MTRNQPPQAQAGTPERNEPQSRTLPPKRATATNRKRTSATNWKRASAKELGLECPHRRSAWAKPNHTGQGADSENQARARKGPLTRVVASGRPSDDGDASLYHLKKATRPPHWREVCQSGEDMPSSHASGISFALRTPDPRNAPQHPKLPNPPHKDSPHKDSPYKDSPPPSSGGRPYASLQVGAGQQGEPERSVDSGSACG
jgi:hypothetical protein